MSSSTARQSPRIEYRIPVQLAQPGAPFDSDSMACQTINVSAGGMALGVPAPVTVGETVVCHLLIAGERLSLTAEVTWAYPLDGNRSDAMANAQIGIRFDSLEGHDGDVLQQLLEAAAGPGQPVFVRFEGMQGQIRARGTVSDGSVQLSASLPILSSGTPVDLRLTKDGPEIEGQVLQSRLVTRGRMPVLEVDIAVTSGDRPRTRRRTFYGRASQLKTLEEGVAHIGNSNARLESADRDRPDTHPDPPDSENQGQQRARLHTRRLWQPTPVTERASWPQDDDTARDLPLQQASQPERASGAKIGAAPKRARRRRRQPRWSTVLVSAVASALMGFWLAETLRPQPAPQPSQLSQVQADPAASDMPGSRDAVETTVSAATRTKSLVSVAPADNQPVRVTANRQQIRVQIPIAGMPSDIQTRLWKEPVAVIAQLQGTRVLTRQGNHRIGREGINRVSIAGTNAGPQIRVITSQPVANYSVTATAQWLEIRITPQRRPVGSP